MDKWMLILSLAQPVTIDGFDSYEACRSAGASQKTCNRPEDSVLNICWSAHFDCVKKPAGSVVTVGKQLNVKE